MDSDRSQLARIIWVSTIGTHLLRPFVSGGRTALKFQESICEISSPSDQVIVTKGPATLGCFSIHRLLRKVNVREILYFRAGIAREWAMNTAIRITAKPAGVWIYLIPETEVTSAPIKFNWMEEVPATVRQSGIYPVESHQENLVGSRLRIYFSSMNPSHRKRIWPSEKKEVGMLPASRNSSKNACLQIWGPRKMRTSAPMVWGSPLPCIYALCSTRAAEDLSAVV